VPKTCGPGPKKLIAGMGIAVPPGMEVTTVAPACKTINEATKSTSGPESLLKSNTSSEFCLGTRDAEPISAIPAGQVT